MARRYAAPMSKGSSSAVIVLLALILAVLLVGKYAVWLAVIAAVVYGIMALVTLPKRRRIEREIARLEAIADGAEEE